MLLDAGLCVVLLIFIIFGVKRGFIRSLVELLGSIVSVVASIMLSQRVAQEIHPYLKSFLNKGTKLVPESVLERAISVILIFIVLGIVVHILADVLDSLFRLPVLRQINALLGGVFGLLKGCVVVLLICAIMQLFAPASIVKPNLNLNTNWQKISKSDIYQYINEKNPVYSLFKEDIWNEVGKNEGKK